MKAESGVYQTWICGYRYEERLAQQESAALSKCSKYVHMQLRQAMCL